MNSLRVAEVIKSLVELVAALSARIDELERRTTGDQA
jgi:hypothetical protein